MTRDFEYFDREADFQYTCWSCVQYRGRCKLARHEYPYPITNGVQCPDWDREPGSDEQERDEKDA